MVWCLIRGWHGRTFSAVVALSVFAISCGNQSGRGLRDRPVSACVRLLEQYQVAYNKFNVGDCLDLLHSDYQSDFSRPEELVQSVVMEFFEMKRLRGTLDAFRIGAFDPDYNRFVVHFTYSKSGEREGFVQFEKENGQWYISDLDAD